MFFDDKVRHLDSTKNDMAALNHECLAKIWNPGNILQMHNCKLRFGVSHEKLDLYSDTSTLSEAFKVLGWCPFLGLTLAPCVENFIITDGWGWGYSETLWIVVWFTNIWEIIKSEECHPHTCTTNILWVWPICWDFFVNLRSSSDAKLFMSWT